MTASPSEFLCACESNCLKIQALGRHIIEQKDVAVQKISAAIQSQPVRAALIDLRDVPGPYTFMDRVKLGEAAGRYLLGTPIAVVLTEEQADPDRIGMVVARNRGANVQVFTDEGAAQAWVQRYLTPLA